MPSFNSYVAIFLSIFVTAVICGSKDKPHGHKGVLEAYTGKPLPFKITDGQSKKLDGGEPVLDAIY